METRSWTWINKSEWGEGPWQQECDKLQWTDEDTGLPCLIVRGPIGALCGYVGVAEGHPMYEVNYDTTYKEEGGWNIDVHGGLTFSAKCSESKEHGVCHLDAGDGPRWWLGFDCNHSDDLAPMMKMRGFSVPGEGYKDIRYVRQEVKQLASQLVFHVEQS